ncbi:uncharacterized protein LDX57_006041 [Aspergillus melleus]|uniref:uncharacterized protein n=1 Tax=Aspergillus melleus TaxID=138277 RepID=UPI001E8DA63A|nr:uncharacterized protein LDX57_006041 [Aspergillus melleus]KAH8428340.1 hypothetical protein LDX57_006041 [Aspergillus melleus]
MSTDAAMSLLSEHSGGFGNTSCANVSDGNSVQHNGNIFNISNLTNRVYGKTERAVCNKHLKPVRIIPQALCFPFLGRETEHAEIVDALTRGEDASSRVVVWGTIGVGKTQLARQCLEDIHLPMHMIWLRASSIQELSESISWVLEKIEINPSLRPRSTALADWLEECGTDGEEWLLVLDDVRETTYTAALATIPHRMRRGRVLITTRTKELAIKAVSPFPYCEQVFIELGAFDLDHAYKLFMHVCDGARNRGAIKYRNRDEQDMVNKVKEILTRLGCFPLAVHSAANYRRKRTLDATWEGIMRVLEWEDIVLNCYGYRFYQQQPALKYALDSYWESKYKPDPDFESLSAILNITCFLNPDKISVKLLRQLNHTTNTWSLKFARLVQSPVTNFFSKRNGRLLVRHDDKAVQSPSERLERTIDRLENLSLLTRFDDGQYFWVHKLIQPLIQSKASVEEAVKLVCNMSPTDLAECEEILLHVDSLSRHIGEYSNCNELRRDLLGKIDDIGHFLMKSERFAEAGDLFEEVLYERRKQSTQSHKADIFQSLNNLASALCEQRRYSEAEVRYREALKIQLQALEYGQIDHIHTLPTRDHLASAWLKMGYLKDAEDHYREALCIRLAKFGEDDDECLKNRDMLANVLQKRGQLKKAEEEYGKALCIRLEKLGEDHPDTLMNRDVLAEVFEFQGMFMEAEDHYREALEIRKITLGDQDHDTQVTYENLALVLCHQKRYEEAEKYYRGCLNSRLGLLGRDDEYTLDILHNLADVLKCQERFEEAEELLTDFGCIE